jgi:hypothetical protein
MSVIIKQRGQEMFWTGCNWSDFEDDSAVYDAVYAESIIVKRWPKGVKLYKRADDGSVVVKGMARLTMVVYRGEAA